jgi:hypothetical protein
MLIIQATYNYLKINNNAYKFLILYIDKNTNIFPFIIHLLSILINNQKTQSNDLYIM